MTIIWSSVFPPFVAKGADLQKRYALKNNALFIGQKC